MNSAPSRQNLAFESQPVPSWGGRPFQLVTLLDMLPFEAHLFFFSVRLLDGFDCDLRMAAEARGPESQITAREIEKLTVRMRGISNAAERFGFRRTIEMLGDIETEIAFPDLAPAVSVILRDFNDLRRAVLRDLRDQAFLILPSDDTKYYQQEQLFGPEVHANFASSRTDVTEAGNCYATGRYTACVFHCMRVVEKGLHALVRELNDKHSAGIVFRDKVEYENWGSIITEIQLALENPKRIQRLAPLPTKEEMTLYSKIAIESEYFKNAWRDDVSHSRSEYDQPAALTVIDHVKAFMVYLAKQGLTE
jgi:HEPN domain-containing protein